MRRWLLLCFIAALALPAAGCGAGAPSSFADCRHSTTRSSGDEPTRVLARTYDCLVRAYHDDCSPARALIGAFGIDTGADYAVRVYRRGSRCAGDVTVTSTFMGRKHKPEKLSCKQAYLFAGRLSLFGCDMATEFAFTRGEDCTHLLDRVRQEACRRAGRKCPPARKRPPRPSPFTC